MGFITNRWVRGKDFYGREALLERLMGEGTEPVWVLGNRRVGKTSLLRQIDWLIQQRENNKTLVLYWDFQGAGTSQGLQESFLECLEDSPKVLEALDLEIDELEDKTFSDTMNKFRRKVKGLTDANLVLLIDEIEEIVDICKKDPSVLAALRKLRHGAVSLKMIVAGSLRLMELDESGSKTSPFLPDFLPPVPLGPFNRETTLHLLAHEGISPEHAGRIFELSLGNPHLVQTIGLHLQQTGDFEETINALKQSKVFYYFFESNFNCLPAEMRAWWKEGLASESLAKLAPGGTHDAYAKQSALIRRDGGTVVVNPLILMLEGHRDAVETSHAEAPGPQAVKHDVPPAGTGAGENSGPGNSPDQSENNGNLSALVEAAKELAAVLATRQKPLGVLPLPEDKTQMDLDAVKDAQTPPSLTMMFNAGEPAEKLHAVLDQAAPEFVLEQTPDARTHVYLVGLHLYHLVFGKAPFSEITDAWDRSAAITERDVPIERPAQVEPKMLMILARALKAKPGARYPDVATLQADLEAIPT